MVSTPQTEHEWTVHSINIHGIFFERWCQRAVTDAPGWRVDSTNYPVEFPPPNGPVRGRESTLDIRASRQVGDIRLSLLIECKKNNPHFVNWVFFRKTDELQSEGFIVSQVQNIPRVAPAEGWDTNASIRRLTTSFIVADEARETRGSYLPLKNTGDKTKTSNAAIQDAAYQVSLAKQAIAHEDEHVSRRLGGRTSAVPLTWQTKQYFPTIVTTARLYLCSFDPKDVNGATGEIAAANASISEQKALVFEYPLPRYLQSNPADIASTYGEGLANLFMRLHILIVQSEHFPEFLRTFYGEPSVHEETAAPGAG